MRGDHECNLQNPDSCGTEILECNLSSSADADRGVLRSTTAHSYKEGICTTCIAILVKKVQGEWVRSTFPALNPRSKTATDMIERKSALNGA
jgi:hypothetical protein